MNTLEWNGMTPYDMYGTFSAKQYFTGKYGIVPSKIPLYLDAEEKREIYDRALQLIDRETYDLRPIRRKWTISKTKNDRPEEDYVYHEVFEAAAVGLCLVFELDHDQITAEFYYDHRVAGLENWIVKQLGRLRESFGVTKSPVFRILSKERDCFYTEKVKVDTFEVDLDRHYNDDFRSVDREIRAAIDEKRSGLILLHGTPGTGKTSYVKALMSGYVDTKFIFVPNDFVGDLLKPDFVTFLIKQKNAILVIEDAEKIIISRDKHESNSVVSTILQLTDGLFSDYLNIKVICTFNTDVSKVDKALFRKGRLIAFYEFNALSVAKTKALLNGHANAVNQGMTLAEIYHFAKTDYSEQGKKKRIGF